MHKGLLMVFTGDGKGKTTSALGLALRGAGHGLKVCFIQFIKGGCKYGELEAIKKYQGLIDFHVMGNGFTWKSDNIENDIQMAGDAWKFAEESIRSCDFHLVVLDEFTYLLNYCYIDLKSVIETLSKRPSEVHVAITGRGAPLELQEIADMVTEMRDIKHHFKSGIRAQKGIEF